jgi:hypothetical protein
MTGASQIVYVSPAAKRILRTRDCRAEGPKAAMARHAPMRRSTFDGLDPVPVIMQLLESMAARLDRVLEALGGQSDKTDDIDQRYQQAEQRRQDIQKEQHIAKIERLSDAHEQKKAERKA